MNSTTTKIRHHHNHFFIQSSVREHPLLLLAHDRVHRALRQQREPRDALPFPVLLHQQLRRPRDDVPLHLDLLLPGLGRLGHRGAAGEFLAEQLARLGELDAEEVEAGDGGDGFLLAAGGELEDEGGLGLGGLFLFWGGSGVGGRGRGVRGCCCSGSGRRCCCCCCCCSCGFAFGCARRGPVADAQGGDGLCRGVSAGLGGLPPFFFFFFFFLREEESGGVESKKKGKKDGFFFFF